MIEYTPEKVRLDRLLLDPNNYRFFDMDQYTKAQPNRLHEASVQQRAEDLIKLDGKEELRALKESIEVNGYVPVETLVIKPYDFEKDMFLVVEGNRRVAAMRWLKRDREAGSPVSENLVESFNMLPAIVLQGEENAAKTLQHVLMGLRHVSGIKQWGGYQRAKLVVELVDDFGLKISEAAKQIGMSSHEASRRYRALKAFEQMQNDEEFGTLADPRMYRLFHEAVSVVKVKDWLGWHDEEIKFNDDINLEKFYKLLVPFTPDDEEESGRARDPKIRTYLDVRNLRDILGNIEAEECLFDPDKSFNEALAIAKASTAPNWTPRIQAAAQTLKRMPTSVLKSLSETEITPIKELYNLLMETLNDWIKLTDNELEL
jgi:hypothetical protein